MVTKNQLLLASLALSAQLVSAASVVETSYLYGGVPTGTGIHAASSLPDGGTYTNSDCKSTDKNCISTLNKGAGYIGTGWIILIVCAVMLPIILVIVYCCCIKPRHKNDDQFHKIVDTPTKPVNIAPKPVYIAPKP
jgi:hypothetical protein